RRPRRGPAGRPQHEQHAADTQGAGRTLTPAPREDRTQKDQTRRSPGDQAGGGGGGGGGATPAPGAPGTGTTGVAVTVVTPLLPTVGPPMSCRFSWDPLVQSSISSIRPLELIFWLSTRHCACGTP